MLFDSSYFECDKTWRRLSKFYAKKNITSFSNRLFNAPKSNSVSYFLFDRSGFVVVQDHFPFVLIYPAKMMKSIVT